MLSLSFPPSQRKARMVRILTAEAPPPQRQLRWAMKSKRCGLIYSKAELIFKIKAKDSRAPILPLVVDSPKHWVWRGF